MESYIYPDLNTFFFLRIDNILYLNIWEYRRTGETYNPKHGVNSQITTKINSDERGVI